MILSSRNIKAFFSDITKINWDTIFRTENETTVGDIDKIYDRFRDDFITRITLLCSITKSKLLMGE